MTTIISLIGEQNLPNLLPILYLKPARVILVYTNFTTETAVRLARLIQEKTKAEVTPLLVDAYDIDQARSMILETVQPFPTADILVNFTGGTKMMSLAAYQAAVELNAPIFYVQSQGKKTILYTYMPDNGRYPLQKTEEIPSRITIDDYLRACVSNYQIIGIRGSVDDPGHIFERCICQTLEPAVDEIVEGVKLLGALEVDFVVRCGNQVGIIEAKSGSALRKQSINSTQLGAKITWVRTRVNFLFLIKTGSKNLI